MLPLRLIAVAAIASGGLALAAPAVAAPRHVAAAHVRSGEAIPVSERGQGGWRAGEDWRDSDRQRDRGRYERPDGRHAGDGHRYDGRGDRDGRDRGDHYPWNRGDPYPWNRGDPYPWNRGDPYPWYRGKHYGWDRGNHYGWDRGPAYGWGDRDYYRPREHVRWRAHRHPYHHRWVGHYLPPRTHYVVIHHYDDYYLPPPRRGYYYARVDNDVYLVAEATKLIIDAFVLLDAASR